MSRLPLVSPLDRALFLKAQPYLDGLRSSVLTALASYTEEQFYPAGSTIRERGKPIDKIFFIADGTVQVANADLTSRLSQSIEAPGVVGLAHHFAATPSPPGVTATADAICLEISTSDLDQILEDHFSLLLQMSRSSSTQAVLNFKLLKGARPPEPGFSTADLIDTPVILDFVHKLARAKRTPFLRKTNLTVIGELIRLDEPKLIKAGDVLWAEGDPIDRIALVLDGSFSTVGDGAQCHAPSGAAIGAWEILLEEPRFETWIADETSRCIYIDRNLFIDVLEDHFEFSRSYMQQVSQRVVEGWALLSAANA
ncbi:MAG: CRP-like cAMP-binding protein [Myxococcota bacterium]|jgi:CRP-like cAMP-binding protein